MIASARRWPGDEIPEDDRAQDRQREERPHEPARVVREEARFEDARQHVGDQRADQRAAHPRREADPADQQAAIAARHERHEQCHRHEAPGDPRSLPAWTSGMSEPGTPCKRSAAPASPRRRGFLDRATPSGAAIRTTVAGDRRDGARLRDAPRGAGARGRVRARTRQRRRDHDGRGIDRRHPRAPRAAGPLRPESRRVHARAVRPGHDRQRTARSDAAFTYGWVQALLSLLILVGQSLDTPDAAVGHAFHDLANVLVAALCAFVAGASPPSAVPAQLQDALGARLRGLASLADRGPLASAATVLALERGARRSRNLLANAWPMRLASRRARAGTRGRRAFADRAHDDVLRRCWRANA